MGSSSSRRRRRMNEDRSGSDASGGSGPDRDASNGSASGNEDRSELVTLISYLIRSGQVRLIPSGSTDDEDDDDIEDNEFVESVRPPKVEGKPDTALMDSSDLKQEVTLNSGRFRTPSQRCQPSVNHMLQRREVGMRGKQQFSRGDQCILSSNFLPNQVTVVARYPHKAFCGTYSEDGNVFLSACQDQYIRVYDTTNGRFRQFKAVRARDVGWSIIDVAFSPDGHYFIYSSWSEFIHICNVHGEHETHEALNLCPEDSRFCIFSLTFSQDNREIMGGANDGCLYVYDRELNQRTLKIDAHEDDVNAVAFADASSHMLFSGGDDGLVKVWDRRSLREDNPEPVGVMAGHWDGITYIESKGDARYLLSNSKDQSIKLWDVRKFATTEAQQATKRAVARQTWDYRWQQFPRRVIRKKVIPGDTSIMTYRGHSILYTLIRCHFSPEFTTGQRYIYTGCATGGLIIYDTLTGDIVKRLEGPRACVRDVAWHPFEHNIMTASWDGTIGKWYHEKEPDTEPNLTSDESDDDTDSDEGMGLRRSKRLRNKSRGNTGGFLGLFS
ncbi:DDB1- and CUL4-associated factor 11-like [Lineus longissimus]|uniref:DDB1- and CUL4-associated factor 11-like n=1 Tax=Lineus longissimus TaxID=88925 RepID=UPI002B4F5A64